MAVRMCSEDIPELLKWLQKELPYSMSVYMCTKLISRGLTGYEVFVDRWPDSRAVLIRPSEEGFHTTYHEKCTCLFFVDADMLTDLLQQSGIYTQSHVHLILAWESSFTKAGDIIRNSDNPGFEEVLCLTANVYIATRVPPPPPLPVGYSARSLTVDDYETILSGVWYKDFDYVKSVKRCLALDGLGVGVEDSAGQLVAWTLQQVTGFLGMTFVKQEHRNKKLGKYVTVVLAQKMIDQDGFSMAGIEKGNAVSVSLHEHVGFTKMDQGFTSGIFRAKGLDIQVPGMSSAQNKNWKE